MFKNLAIAALMGKASAQPTPSKDFDIHFGSRFTAGFLEGAKVGKIDHREFERCLEREDDADHIFNKANEEIYHFLKTKDMDLAAEALKDMIYFIIDLAMEKDQRYGHPICEVFEEKGLDYKLLEIALRELRDPDTSLVNHHGALTFNRQDISKEAEEMLKTFEAKDYTGFGYILGETLINHENESPELIQARFGSEFAIGFLKGARVGDVEIQELFYCLEREPDAEQIFVKANEDIKKMFETKDKNEGVDGLANMLLFIIDMAQEKSETGQHKCEAFGNMDLKYEDLRAIMTLQKDPDTAMQMMGGHFTFNKLNLDHEANWMVKEYSETNFVGFGYALGDSLAKNDGLHPGPPLKDAKLAVQAPPSDEIKFGSEFTAGFLAGSAAGTIKAEDFVECLEREPDAVSIFEKGIADIKKFFEDKDPEAGVEGLSEMIKFVVNLASERDQRYGHAKCDVFEQKGMSYERLDEALGEFYDPDTTLMYQDKRLFFNRQDIDNEAEYIVEKIKAKDWAGFGKSLGQTLIWHSGEGSHLEAMRFGSEFAVGFLKGAKVGELNITDLFNCLDVETDADHIFLKANAEIGEMFENRDPEAGVQGLTDLVSFIITMATDKDPRYGKRECPAYAAEGLNYDDLKKIVELQKSQETAMKIEKGRFTFNHHDLDHEAEWMARSYAEHNIVEFGYALGDTLAKHDSMSEDTQNLFLY